MTQTDGEIYHVGGLENEYTTQSILQWKWIYCPKQSIDLTQSLSSYQWYFSLEQIISQFVWKQKKPRIAKAILRKKNGNGRINLPDFRKYTTILQSILQNYSRQDSMVLAQRQKYRSIEQNRKPRDKHMHLSVMTVMIKTYEKYSLDLNEVHHENRK